ncbi:plasmid mobilization protein [Salinibacter ruber]|nr:hypothetical protein [Salinibacter ruber]MCS3612959.1 hypothetical protein [Salinibacter ruber]
MSSDEKSSNGPGRPPKPPEERRTENHGLRLSPKEKKNLRRRAEEAGLSMSEYLRRSALGGEPVRSDAKKKAVRQLSAAGNALNRLVEAAREEKIGSVEGLEETLEAIREAIARL